MRVESGPTLDQRLRTGAFFVMCLGLGGWFLYDGFIGYPSKNLEWARQSLADLTDAEKAAVETNPRIHMAALREMVESYNAKPGLTLDELKSRLGEPSAVLPRRLRYEGERVIVVIRVDDDGNVLGVRREEPNPDHKNRKINPLVTPPLVDQINVGDSRAHLLDQFGDASQTYRKVVWYVGPASYGRFEIENGRVAGEPNVAENDKRSEGDLQLQKVLGAGALLLGVWAALRFFRILTLKVVVDDSGLSFNRKQIQWDATKRLDTRDWDRKAWLDLIYEENGDEKALRLDSYHLAQFDSVLKAICERKGFELPQDKKEDEPKDDGFSDDLMNDRGPVN